MSLETEALTFIKVGFYIVYIISVVFILNLQRKDPKNKSYRWFYVQLFILFFGAQKFFKFIELKPEISQSMLSEDNSLLLGTAGLYWGISMFLMLIGIQSLVKKIKLS
ncbi:MAG: hypothetical protein RBR71_11070 [Gudongella sp.]|nr:hypothetical protein [Gudongella sp.]